MKNGEYAVYFFPVRYALEMIPMDIMFYAFRIDLPADRDYYGANEFAIIATLHQAST